MTTVLFSDTSQVFPVSLIKSFTAKGSSSESCVAFSNFSLVSFNPEQFLSLSFVTLILLSSVDQLYCRLCLSWVLSVSSWLDSGHASLVGISQERYFVLLTVSYRVCMILTCPITGDALFDHLTKKVSARLLFYKVLLFAFIMNKSFMGRKFEPMYTLWVETMKKNGKEKPLTCCSSYWSISAHLFHVKVYKRIFITS